MGMLVWVVLGGWWGRAGVKCLDINYRNLLKFLFLVRVVGGVGGGSYGEINYQKLVRISLEEV